MKITLTTLNARYTHTSIALRYLYANIKEFQETTSIKEFTINDNIHEIAVNLLKDDPAIIGIGVYIWNAIQIKELLTIIKKVSPHIKVILGGPEVSYSPVRVDFSMADFIIQGEGEISLYKLLKDIKDGISYENRIISSITPNVNEISLPYKYYTDHDIQNRVIYVEASRGCPFSCEFCLSSIDKKVRDFDIEVLLIEFQNLWNRGARNFKFIDRTFNIKIDKTLKILDFFLGKNEDYMIHFEVIPEYFPAKIREKIKQFKPGRIQLEVGIQTLNPVIAEKMNRKMDLDKIISNIIFLESSTYAHLHVDLIIGLPGESIESFAKSLNLLGGIVKSEIQIGILKKLSGTSINRHDLEYNMIYSDVPPYEILQNNLITYLEMQELKRFSRFWDITYNSGNFKKSVLKLWENGDIFNGFLKFSKWLYKNSQSTYQISLNRLSEFLFTYLTKELQYDKKITALELMDDLSSINGRKIPGFLLDFIDKDDIKVKNQISSIGKRQQRYIN